MSTQRSAALYRMWSKDGALLYVGCTIRIFERLPDHISNKPDSFSIANITLEWFPSRDAALVAESAAIAAEAPRWNNHHNIARQTANKKAAAARESRRGSSSAVAV